MSGVSGRLQGLLGVRYPLLQAGMGGVAGPELAAAVSAAGAGGCLGGYKLLGPQLTQALEATLALTGAPVGVNLIPEVVGQDKLDRQLAQVLEQTPDRVYVFLFGLPEDAESLRRVRRAGRVLMVQVGTVPDAVAAAEHAQVLVAQGTEAGGHLLGTLERDELIGAIRRELPDTCLVAAGGIGSRAQAGASLAAGADGVCAGTAFVPVRESRAHPVYQQAVLSAQAEDTVISEVYSIGWPGRRHRVLSTPVTRDPAQRAAFIGRTRIAGRQYPVPRFSAAVPTVETTGAIEQMAQYCGLSCASVTSRLDAAQLVRELVG